MRNGRRRKSCSKVEAGSGRSKDDTGCSAGRERYFGSMEGKGGRMGWGWVWNGGCGLAGGGKWWVVRMDDRKSGTSFLLVQTADNHREAWKGGGRSAPTLST